MTDLDRKFDLEYPRGLDYVPEPYVDRSGEEEHDELHLDFDQYVETDKKVREKSQFFICLICKMIVSNPVECSNCSTLFCQKCIEPWHRSNDFCPKKCSGD